MAREESDSARRIPATAAAMVDLLNSRPHGPGFPDTLQTPETASAVLRPFGQPAAEVPSPQRIAKVRGLRTTLMDIASAPDSAEAAPGWAQLAERASAVTLRQDFSEPGTVRLRQVGGDPVVGGITLAVAELVSDGTWPRLRICANELCSHVFYDTTRSRTQRWHSYEVCGNKSNVAAYRARRKTRPGS
ncbi:CGNR zinc finger domain-containing protein [Streptomyces melanosporofaciens]|nr:CGNR zinc finger domain-containing protein [Streptomyces melanosporofaciens]